MFENWNREDERCPCCNQVTKRVRGITKQNLKRLCHIKPASSVEWTLIIFFLLFILIAWVYKIETAECRKFAKEIKEDQTLQDFIKNNSNSTIVFAAAPYVIANETERG